MGAVCRAHDTRLEREVAVKVMTAVVTDADEQARLRERFYREARSAARLRHPNVVTVHDFGTDPALGIDFLVMELLAGEDLAARMRRAGGPLAPSEALEIAREAAMGLAAGHRAGLVHRDVKPGNLFLASDGGQRRVKVLDFGIAQVAASDAETVTRLTVFGAPHTPRYASPEQLRGAGALTPASDVYSLALTIVEALLGAYPDGLNTAEHGAASAAVLARLRQRNPGVPPQVTDALTRALAVDPGRRPADADAFLAALDGASIDSPPIEGSERGGRADARVDAAAARAAAPATRPRRGARDRPRLGRPAARGRGETGRIGPAGGGGGRGDRERRRRGEARA